MVPLYCGCGSCGDCDACTVVCVACLFAARLLGCEGDGNAGVVAVSAYTGGTCGSAVLASASDALEMSVVRGVGVECVTCICVWLGVGWEVFGVGG